MGLLKWLVDDDVRRYRRQLERLLEDAERRVVRAYVLAAILIITAGLVHFLLVRSQVRALLNAARTVVTDPTQSRIAPFEDGADMKRGVDNPQSQETQR